MADIHSPHNAKIKLLRALQKRQGRRKHGLFVVEGLRHVGAAVEAGADIAFLLWSPERLTSAFGKRLIAEAQQRGVPVWTSTPEALDAASPREHSQGIVAAVRPRALPLESLAPTTHPWLVAVTAAQTPGNIGTLLRTVDAVGASALLLLDGGTDPYAPAAVRASMGAIFWVPLVQTPWEAFHPWAQRHGYRLYGSSARGSAPYDRIAYTPPMVLLLGNERHGLTPAQREACDAIAVLPMEGHGTSLNLAVAAGVLLYAMRGAQARGQGQKLAS